MGGLPPWLLAIPGMQIRCFHEVFLEKVRNYLQELFRLIHPYLSTNGGNIIAVQLENEYGSFGNDHAYLRAVADIYRENGIDCTIFTSDGPGYFMLNGGALPEYLTTVNFGSNPEDNFNLLKKFKPEQPLMCTEYWNGWFDHWYEEHHKREAGDTAQTFQKMLDCNASVNFYMFHGGTNFGFTNGANYDNGLQPTVTS
jgi:beta-galactosidase